MRYRASDPWESLQPADALVLAVAHEEYLRMPLDGLPWKVKRGGCVIDVKSVLDRGQVARAGRRIWRL